MNRKTLVAGIVIGVVVISIVIGGGLLILSPPQFDSSFTFHITGGTVIDYTPDNHITKIWNQGFNLTFANLPDYVNSSTQYSIFIANINNRKLTISGLESTESYQILNETCLFLSLTSNPKVFRIVEILSGPINQISDGFTFAVIGDTQGFSMFYENLVKETSVDFILHLGDITADGSEERLRAFQKITMNSTVPVFSTPGNHDIKKLNSTDSYKRYFGNSEYYFNYGGYLFISLDSTKASFSEKGLKFLEVILNKFPNIPKVIFTHMPLFDPRGNDNDHALLNKTQSTQILSMIANYNVKLVLSGHIHYFNHTVKNGTHFLTSGGGGAILYEPPERGGFYHYTKIKITTNSINITPIVLTRPIQPTDIHLIKGGNDTIISLQDLQSEFTIIQGNSSFQNQYDNWRGYGSYIGVSVAVLVNKVGGMLPTQILEVESWDSLKENFSFPVIYPNDTFKTIQGELILAFSYNNTLVPYWSDGYRIIFLPSDEKYSNTDCLTTSPPGEGCRISGRSAGSRWVKYVKSLRIIGEE